MLPLRSSRCLLTLRTPKLITPTSTLTRCLTTTNPSRASNDPSSHKTSGPGSHPKDSGSGSQASTPGWGGRPGTDHVLHRDGNDAQSAPSREARRDKETGKEGSGAISQRDERNAKQRAKEEFPEGTDAIGMNSGEFCLCSLLSVRLIGRSLGFLCCGLGFMCGMLTFRVHFRTRWEDVKLRLEDAVWWDDTIDEVKGRVLQGIKC